MSASEMISRQWEDAPRTYETNPLKRSAVITTLLVLVAGTVVLCIAAGQWLSVSTPALLLLCGSVPITAVATLIVTSHEQRTTRAQLIGPVLVSLAISLSLGTSIGLLWKEVSVRTSALTTASSLGITPVLQGAMRSNDGALSVLACTSLLESGSPQDAQQAYQGLLSNPQHFEECILTEERRQEWGARLVEGWMGTIQGLQDKDEICAWTDTLARSKGKVPGAPSALLSCALSSKGAQQACCTESLLRHESSHEQLAEQLASYPPHKIYESLMATQLVEHASGEAKGKLGIAEAEQLKRFGYLAACRSMSVDRVDLMNTMTNAVISVCQIRESSMREDPEFWISLCDDLAYDAVVHEDQGIDTLLCKETTRRMMTVAVDAARTSVLAAITDSDERNRARMGRMAGDINSAAVQSGFQGSDSTGIVGAFEDSPYSRAEKGIHGIGQRKLSAHKNKKYKKFKRPNKSQRAAIRREAEASGQLNMTGAEWRKFQETQTKLLMEGAK